MVIIDIVINILLSRLTLDPAGMHCPAWDNAFVSSYSCNGLRDIFYVRNHDHWPFWRITLLSGLLVPLWFNLVPNFVESPLQMPTCSKSRFYVGIFLFAIFIVCNKTLPTESCIQPLSWYGIFPLCQESEEL